MIEVTDLSYQTILDSISFQVPTGTCLAIVGHNGAGKTTLFHVLLGIKFQTKGRIHRLEKNYGYVPERPYLEMEESLYSFLKLHLNLILFPRAMIEDEIKRVVDLVGLQGQLNHKFQNFSKGMLQKALLAQALLGSPQLIFLDEPMSGLDSDSRIEMMEYLLEIKKTGTQLVFSSHLQDDVVFLADQVLVLDHGKQAFFGSIDSWRSK